MWLLGRWVAANNRFNDWTYIEMWSVIIWLFNTSLDCAGRHYDQALSEDSSFKWLNSPLRVDVPSDSSEVTDRDILLPCSNAFSENINPCRIKRGVEIKLCCPDVWLSLKLLMSHRSLGPYHIAEIKIHIFSISVSSNLTLVTVVSTLSLIFATLYANKMCSFIISSSACMYVKQEGNKNTHIKFKLGVLI